MDSFNKKQEIMVSILVITYQHEKYISKALDSVLMQKTQYPMEVLIADDCSTDGTKEILRSYKKKYGNRINLYLRYKNVGACINSYYVWCKARGKYIVVLEGDDYWTDPYKIEKQINFLETHNDCMGVFHKCHIVDQYDKINHKINYNDLYDSKNKYTLHDFEQSKLPGHTATFMYKNIFRNSNGKYNFIYKLHNLIGDQTLYCILLSQGYLSYIDEDMSAYRLVVKKNGTNATSKDVYNNNTLIMWKYYCDLETIMNKRFDVCVNLSKHRKNMIKSAYLKFTEKMSLDNFFIICKIVALDMIWKLLKPITMYNNKRR